MDNLTKENFFNEITQKYPKAMDKFCKWIDEYKKKNNWDIIFNPHRNSKGIWQRSPKYHELPLAMQLGIFMEFLFEVDPSRVGDFLTIAKESIIESFEELSSILLGLEQAEQVRKAQE